MIWIAYYLINKLFLVLVAIATELVGLSILCLFLGFTEEAESEVRLRGPPFGPGQGLQPSRVSLQNHKLFLMVIKKIIG